jgi:hypothetical protein
MGRGDIAVRWIVKTRAEPTAGNAVAPGGADEEGR